MQGDAIAFMRTLNLIHLLLRDQQRVVAPVSTSAVHAPIVDAPIDEREIQRRNPVRDIQN